MGELSKSSGELGEDYVVNFLKSIGWDTTLSNESIPCCESDKHNVNNAIKGRQTHGIDELYTYMSPMDTNMLVNAIVSVKHTDKLYPSSPSSKFKEHMVDLAYAIECFENSNLKDETFIDEFNDDETIGVLFWISSESSRSYSVVSELNNIFLKSDLHYKRIHVIDNERIEFINKSLEIVTGKKFFGYEFSFHYIDTPNNLGDNNKKTNGNFLPIEMLNSDIQIFKLQKDKEIILVFVIKDEFHEDSLKRILGLAHRVSNNLASNIQIFFPFFEHHRQENKNKINKVKNQFKEKSFINTTNIYGYDIGFKDVDETIFISDKMYDDEIIEPSLDDGKFLPYGEYLRSLLSDSLITDTELKKLLREKGIYVCNGIKEETIPILSSLLLTPREFNTLKEHHKTKEDKENRQSSRFKTEVKPTVESLKKVLTVINFNDIDRDKFTNYKYKIPKRRFQVDEEKKQLKIDYEIERHQKNKSWDKQIDNFKGTVILDCNGNTLELISESISTSKETLKINKKIIGYIEQRLKEQKIISQDAKEEKILMGDMRNEEIIAFLLEFTNNNILKNIEFLNVISIDIEIDESITLPENSQIKWMESKIKKLKLDGNKIEDIEILTDNQNHKYLKCWGIIIEYKFDNFSGNGTALVELKFNPSNKGEFSIQIEKCKFDKKLYRQKKINEMILSDINMVKHSKHKEIMEGKS